MLDLHTTMVGWHNANHDLVSYVLNIFNFYVGLNFAREWITDRNDLIAQLRYPIFSHWHNKQRLENKKQRNISYIILVPTEMAFLDVIVGEKHKIRPKIPHAMRVISSSEKWSYINRKLCNSFAINYISCELRHNNYRDVWSFIVCL